MIMTPLVILFYTNKPVGETVELYYQYQYDYVFSSKKFEDYFGIQPTPYRDGIKEAAHRES